MLVFNNYFYKNRKSKLYFGDRVARGRAPPKATKAMTLGVPKSLFTFF
jgi:hypothetical protein